jgi:hypothetical protein
MSALDLDELERLFVSLRALRLEAGDFHPDA